MLQMVDEKKITCEVYAGKKFILPLAIQNFITNFALRKSCNENYVIIWNPTILF